EEIVKNGPITVDGRTYPTINDYITHLTETTGGFTKIVYDQTTGDVIFQEWDASTNSWVNVDNSKFETIVKANETVTVLAINKNGTYTYYNENEIDADGNPILGEGVTIDPALVIVEDLSKSEGKYIFKDSEGNDIATIDINADNILYDNSTSGLASTNVKDALDELVHTIATTKGSLTSTSIYVDGGADALLKDAKLDLKGGSADGQVLVTVTKEVVVGQDADGNEIKEERKVTEWQDPKEVVSATVTAKNGITVVNDTDGNSEFRLGGPLDKPTTIETDSTNTLAIDGLTSLDKDNVSGSNVVMADKDGVLQQTSIQNLIEKAIDQGDLEAKTLSTDGVIVIGDSLESTETSKEHAVLQNVKLNIGKDKITSDHIGTGAVGSDEIIDGSVAPIDMLPGGNSSVLVTDANGETKWIPQAELNNRDTFVGTAPVDVVAKADINATGGNDYTISVANANGTTLGVVKEADTTPTINFVDGVATVNVENLAATQGQDLTSESLVVTDGEKVLLRKTNIEIKAGKTDGQVLVTTTKDVVVGQNPDGSDQIESRKVTEWVNADQLGVQTTNGVEKIVGADGVTRIGLGGELTQPTILTTDSTKTLAIKGLDEVEKNPTANNLVIADSEGVLKQTSAKNMIEDVITQGNLEAKMLKGVGITVTAGENAGTNLNTEVASSLLKDVTLGIADKAVTAGKLDAGTSTTDAPRIGVADKDGNVTYQDLQTVVQAEQKTVVLEDGTNTTVSSRVDATKPNETIWKVDVATAVKTVATATELLAADAVVLVNAEAAPTEGIVIKLPTANESNKGKKYTIKKLDTNEDGYVVIEGNVAGLNGKTLETGLPYSGWDFVSDGTQWQIVNKF
ncbi:hypothetical protein ACPDHL_15565, partial [Myroides sp. C15-4]